MSGSDVDAPPPPPPPPQSQTPVVAQAPHTMSTIKLPILKKGEYDVWAMKMEHYLDHTNYPLWEIIQKGNGHVNVSTDTHGIMKVLPPKTAEETLAREKERKVRTTLLLALPEDHLEKSKKNKANDNSKRLGKKEESNALMTLDGGCVDWTSHSEEEEDYALMACNSSGSNTEYEEKIRFMKIDLDDKIDVLTYHKKLLAEAEKEKEDLKAKVEKWHNSSKNLGKLLNTQMSANDKFGLGYGDHRYDGILSYENEVLQSVFMNKESDLENQPLYDRFVIAEGLHAVPLPMTGNYMPSGLDIEIDYSQFTYGPKQTQTSESETQTSDFNTCESDCKEYESESESEHVCLYKQINRKHIVLSNQAKVKNPWETVKNQFTHSNNPKVDKKGLGYGFTTKACFVCGSLSHLIRDYDFHEKRMAKQVELNKQKGKGNVQRINQFGTMCK
ncbi:hypothetical protein Tco_1368047 [Tanacetum coccineum]